MDPRMKKLFALALMVSTCGVQAQTFIGVTAKNGEEWLEQCERPATKTEGEVRATACANYLRGAATMQLERITDPKCRESVAEGPIGALLDVSFSFAREYPSAPIPKIVGLSVQTADLATCKH